jgi:tetratricopeptide (TPR) repeat protein
MKRLLVTAGLLAGFALLGGEASAQTGTARGKVVDEKGQPLPEVAVTLDFKGGVSRKYDTKTNKKGEFTQVGIYPGVYRVTVSKEGYQPTFIETKINLGDPTYLPDFKMNSAAAAQAAAGGGAADKALAELRGTVDRAIELTKAGKFDDAAAAYNEVLSKNPNLAPTTLAHIHNNLGMVYALKKDTTAAEAAYQKALELKPDYADAYVGLANLYMSAGQLPKAQEVMAKASAQFPEDPKIQHQVGVVYFNMGKYDEALAALKKAETLDAANPEVHYFLASIAVNQNNTAEAVAQLEKYLSMSPQDPTHAATAQALLQALKAAKK